MAKDEAIFYLINRNSENSIVGSIKRSDNEKKRKNIKVEMENNEHYELYCGCRKPDYPHELQYGFREDLDIYPLRQNKQRNHKVSCPNSEVYKDNVKYNKGMKIETADGKSITTFAIEGFPPRADYRPIIGGGGKIGRPNVRREQIGKLTVTSMLKNLLMSEYEKYSRSENDKYKYENTLEGFMNFLGVRLQSIYIKGYGDVALRDLKIEKNGIKFEYGLLDNIKGITVTDKKDRCVKKYKLIKGEHETIIGDAKVMEIALQEFEETFHMNIFDCMQRGMKIFWAGFRKKYQRSLATYIFDLHFILLSNTGMFAESSNEVMMYDYVNEFINRNYLKKLGVQFFKPYKFGYSVYKCMDCDRDFLEDGLIKIKGIDTEYVIEVFGMETDDYLERKIAKEGVFAAGSDFKLIKWDVLNDESIHVIDSLLEQVKIIAVNNKSRKSGEYEKN